MDATLTDHQTARANRGLASTAAGAVNPIGDRSRGRRLAKVAGAILFTTAALVVLDVLGVDVGGWLGGLWDTLRAVSVPYLLAAVGLQTLQIGFTAAGWLFILRAAYRHADIRFAPILTAYAVGNALNVVLPASVGSLVMLFMFVAIIPGATIAGVLAAFVVQKIFFTVMAALVYADLFATVPGSFSVELGPVRERPALIVLIAIGVLLLFVAVGRAFWAKLRELWLDAKQGAAILESPGEYVVRVFLPSLAGYVAKLGVIGVMLAAFSIPVSFGSVMHVVAGNSIASNTAATPGGAGVTQAISVVALRDYADPQTATAYSVSQQLVTTAWNVGFALILVLTVFGWTNGRALVKESYLQAKKRAAEQHKSGDTAAEAGTA